MRHTKRDATGKEYTKKRMIQKKSRSKYGSHSWKWKWVNTMKNLKRVNETLRHHVSEMYIICFYLMLSLGLIVTNA